jgi:hypothetical protein
MLHALAIQKRQRITERNSPDGVAKRNKHTFKPDQAASMIEMIQQIATVGGAMSDAQREFIDMLRSHFVSPSRKGTWA